MAHFVSSNELVDAIAARLEETGASHGLAVFDADHTLWNADVGEMAFHHAIQHDLFYRNIVEEPFWQWAQPYDLSPAMGFQEALLVIQKEESNGTWLKRGAALNVEPWELLSDLYQMQAWIFAGHTRAELSRLGQQLFEESLEQTCFSYVQPVFSLLREHQIDIRIITASHGFVAEGALQKMDISPDRVFGMTPSLTADGISLPQLARVSYGPGKRQCIEQEMNVRPKFAFGDSVATGDAGMFEVSELAVAVYPKGQHLDAAKTLPHCLILSASPSDDGHMDHDQ